MGQWSFSLKRSNLDIAGFIQRHGGAIIVDSTRRGKSMPDALSKTIPIWCAVLNLASKLLHGSSSEAEGAAWDTHSGVRTPEGLVSPSEHEQIRAQVEAWASALLDSDLEVPKLSKPMKPIFLTPQDQHLPTFQQELPFFPVICLSASRYIGSGGMTYAHSSGGQTFVYMQGAGDDHENWATGLTPEAWWERTNHERLLRATDGEDVEELVREIVERQEVHGQKTWFVPSAPGAKPADTTVGGPAAHISGTCIVIKRLTPEDAVKETNCRLLIICDAAAGDDDDAVDSKVIKLGLGNGKKSLPKLTSALRAALVSGLGTSF